MTKKQLKRFIEIRNQSPFNSNLQFGIDAEEAGFSVKELGAAVKVGPPQAPSYHWETEHGTLIETEGKLSLREASHD